MSPFWTCFASKINPKTNLFNTFSSISTDYGGAVYALNSCRCQQVFYPPNSSTSFHTLGKERSLLCSGKSNKESIQFFTLLRCKAPPGLIVEPVKYHRMKLKTFTFMDGHQGDLAYTLKLIQHFRPVIAILRTFLQKRNEPIPHSLKVPLALISRKSRSQC